MRVTQQDIARLAAVSQATVSRVLAGDERVEPDKRERVLTVIKQSNYRPDVRAQALRRRRTSLVGLVLKRPDGGLKDDPFYSALISEITQVLSKSHYHLCLDVAADSDKQTGVYDELLRTRRVDGLILVEPESEDARLHKLQDDRFPFVVIGNPRTSVMHSVDNDNVLAARIATQHLVENGYRKIGFLGGPSGVAVSEDRLIGYRMVMNENGLVPRVWSSDFGFAAASEASRAVLSSPDRPDALVVLDDFMAMGTARTARQLGLALPGDLGLVSFNDSSLCELVDGGITSVNMNFEQLVQEACRKLIQIIEAKTPAVPSRLVIPCELMVRGSSRRPLGVAR